MSVQQQQQQRQNECFLRRHPINALYQRNATVLLLVLVVLLVPQQQLPQFAALLVPQKKLLKFASAEVTSTDGVAEDVTTPAKICPTATSAVSSNDSVTNDSTKDMNEQNCPVSLNSTMSILISDETTSILNATTESSTTIQQRSLDQHQDQPCGLYLAMSTIPGAGLGAFTGIDRKVNEKISQGDVMIPIYDLMYHLQALGDETMKRYDWEYLDPTRDYVWYGKDIGMQYESAHYQEHISGIAYGLDAAINCHLALYNAQKDHVSYDFTNLHRSKDPGVGAFTPYHNSSTTAETNIVAGSELFKSYGDSWFIDRTETFGMVPLTKDYPKAEVMLKKLHQIFDKCKIPNHVRSDMYHNLVVSSPFYTSSRTLQALPTDYSGMVYIVEHGIKAYHQRNASHSIEYLQQHGRCVDLIQPQRSTIEQAGRGAFATRHISKGSIVIGTPFYFYPSNDFFKLYYGNWFTKESRDFDPKKLVGYQLMYNYCWRHERNISSIVLCPYGMNVNYINHNQSLANVRVQWASDGEMNHNASLLQTSPTAMYYSDAPKLWIDFIATRDIKAGEEIFMDYGTVWEQAWHNHVQKWNQHQQYPTDYVSAHDWNRMNPRAMLRTVEEQRTEPYPDHFRMICLPEIAIPKYSELLNSDVCTKIWNPSVIGLPCRVIGREQQRDGSYWYHVQYRKDTDEWIEVYNWIVREAIRFVNTPYTNDIFLSDAFRQPIGIPDSIFPKAWREIHIPPLPPMKKRKKRPLQKRRQNASPPSSHPPSNLNKSWMERFFFSLWSR